MNLLPNVKSKPNQHIVCDIASKKQDKQKNVLSKNYGLWC